MLDKEGQVMRGRDDVLDRRGESNARARSVYCLHGGSYTRELAILEWKEIAMESGKD